MTSASVLFDAPGPRARVRNRIISVVTLVCVALAGLGVLAKLASR